MGRRATGGPSFFGTLQKSEGFPRFAPMLTSRLLRKWRFSAAFMHFRRDSYVKAFYFAPVKKRLLQAAADNLTKAFPGANPRRGQERKRA